MELEREVREHRLTEAALSEAEMKYRGIFENVVEGIFQTTPDGRYIAANPMLAHIYGFDTAAELITHFTDVSRQLYVDSSRRDEFVHLLEKNDVISEFESQVYRRDGSITWISENARAVRDSLGKLLYYEGTVENITERKRIKETLVFSEKRFRSIWENSGDGMRLTDQDGIIRAVNPAYCRIVNMAPEELEGKPYTVIFALETGGIDRRLEKYKQRFAARSIESRFERGVTIRDGRTVQVVLSNSFIEMDGREPLLLSIFHDITQRKQMEQALRAIPRCSTIPWWPTCPKTFSARISMNASRSPTSGFVTRWDGLARKSLARRISIFSLPNLRPSTSATISASSRPTCRRKPSRRTRRPPAKRFTCR